MGAMKDIDIELQDFNCDGYSLSNADDVFDLVVDAQLTNRKLSALLLSAIRYYLAEDSYTDGPLARLWLNGEFRDALEWHSA